MGVNNSIEHVRRIANSLGLELISEYTNRLGPIKVKCQKGHVIETRLVNLQLRKKHRGSYSCMQCRRDNELYGKEKIDNMIKRFGYDLVHPLPDKFTEELTVSLICKNGHITNRRLSNLKVYPKCRMCQMSPGGWYWHSKNNFHHLNIVQKTGKKSAQLLIAGQLVNLNITEIARKFDIPIYSLYGYEIIKRGDRISKRQRLDYIKHTFKCNKGHVFNTTLMYLGKGFGCRQCATQNVNEPELLIGEWIENLGINIIRRDTRILNGEELDIFIPTHNLAIEYCGIRWHSVEVNPKRDLREHQLRHQQKLLKCRDFNIRLITVFESDFHFKREYVKSVVLDALQGKNAETLDLRYRQLMPGEKFGPPKPHYYDSNYKERPRKSKYTVYDCGEVIL